MNHKNSGIGSNGITNQSPKSLKPFYNKRETRRISFNLHPTQHHANSHLHITDSNLKLDSNLQEPTTPIDKLNTPRTVTVPTTFFPPSPNPIESVENELSIAGNARCIQFKYSHAIKRLAKITFRR
jgi:hypothetical protein